MWVGGCEDIRGATNLLEEDRGVCKRRVLFGCVVVCVSCCCVVVVDLYVRVTMMGSSAGVG